MNRTLLVLFVLSAYSMYLCFYQHGEIFESRTIFEKGHKYFFGRSKIYYREKTFITCQNRLMKNENIILMLVKKRNNCTCVDDYLLE